MGKASETHTVTMNFLKSGFLVFQRNRSAVVIFRRLGDDTRLRGNVN
jgi:hypothetical protein